ncbi:siphovirus Gp157 family protein [Paenibacillus sp. FSL R7-0302]|uniref:siphovirus Gp157 family protein n=1 Tax=Paenibacillus sp. FSL R7-0302 TaxID=2921681 RepID=UPI0030F9676F
MPKLYELSEHYRKLNDYVEDALDSGEELSEDDLQMFIDTIEGVTDLIEIKVENIVKFIRNIEGDIAAYKNEEGRLAKRRKYMENKVKGLEDYMANMLTAANIDVVNAGNFKVKFQTSNASVGIINEERIPEQFRVKQPDKILKADLLKALKRLKEGESIEGAYLINTNRHMRIS